MARAVDLAEAADLTAVAGFAAGVPGADPAGLFVNFRAAEHNRQEAAENQSKNKGDYCNHFLFSAKNSVSNP
ncbi:MAG: hypothetical protein WKG07_23840 [Hymenobacter sp.]